MLRIPTSPPLKLSKSCGEEDEDSYEEEDDIASLKDKGEMVFDALPKGSKACFSFV